MKYRKKGFTLLEILVYLSISSVVLIISTKVLIDTRYIFFSSMNSIQNINCIESGLITIDSLVNDSEIKRIEANDNKVNLYYATNEGQIIKQLINDNNDFNANLYLELLDNEIYSRNNYLDQLIRHFQLEHHQ